ncbi:ribonucleoprotein PTB-binding 2-like isoform X2 [Conger conger]|uniref:ribonucleoprotein PTB-binding 2-like isoform X2 n=1 Tax=Conger conger TaxID=82655 RepID=UPI002A5AD2CA|nr:ribonucleoprotein PTB-binding 2-like isoform X2 [Conger conger]
MAAAFSGRPPTVFSLIKEYSSFPVSDSPETRLAEDSAIDKRCMRELPDLEPGEIQKRLEETHRELSNRRKIIIKHLPQDITSQEVHDILREYELKYCYVDRNKGTGTEAEMRAVHLLAVSFALTICCLPNKAFVTLMNGDQARDAIRSLHQTPVRGREITVQLQSTDALLCITGLPHTFTAGQFQELARVHGNLERCFLVYSERTGHSKGYGFAEYMKKDSASRARSELSGRRHGDRTLMAQWADANRLAADLLHSKCLHVDRLPADLRDSEELSRMFRGRHRPVFCQLAQNEDSHARGFAVLEYETAEQAEAVLMDMDRRTVRGQEVHVSLCPPGASGRSTLAALIAAQGTLWSSRKGLLPEPSLAQLLSSMSTPAALQVLGMPYQNGKHRGKVSRPQGAPFLHHPLSTALIHLGKLQQQNTLLGNGIVLQRLLQMQLAQQQLLRIKDKHISAVPSLLGDPSRVLLQNLLGLQATASTAVGLGQGLPGGSPREISHDAVQVCGLGPALYPPARRTLGLPSSEQSGAPATEIQPTPPGFPTQSLTRGTSRSLACTPNLQKNLHSTRNSASTASVTCGQTSLLGEPPKDVKLPSNPYLDLASVLPGVVLQGAGGGKAQSVQPRAGIHDANRLSTDLTTDYTHQYSPQYSQEAVQPWYQHYQAQDYARTALEGAASEYGHERNQASSWMSTRSTQLAAGSLSCVDYSTYTQPVGQYYSQPHLIQAGAHTHHRDTSKEGNPLKTPHSGIPHSVSNGSHPGDSLPTYGCVPTAPAYVTARTSGPGSAVCPETGQTPSDWSQFFCNQTHGQKHDYSQLLVPSCMGQLSQNHDQDYSKKRWQ